MSSPPTLPTGSTRYCINNVHCLTAVISVDFTWMSAVNAGEFWYVTARRTSPENADRSIEELLSLGVQIEPADWKAARQAGVFKSKHKMSYAGP